MRSHTHDMHMHMHMPYMHMHMHMSHAPDAPRPAPHASRAARSQVSQEVLHELHDAGAHGCRHLLGVAWGTECAPPGTS